MGKENRKVKHVWADPKKNTLNCRFCETVVPLPVEKTAAEILGAINEFTKAHMDCKKKKSE